MESENAAHKMASYASHKLNKGPFHEKISDYTLAQWASKIAPFLVTSLDAKRASGVDIRNPQDETMAKQARELLSYARANGINVDGYLAKLDSVTNLASKASGEVALLGSVESVVSAFNANSFGFKKKFLGKTIEVTGKVRSVHGGNEYVSISFLGNTKKSKDEVGFQDMLECIITSEPSMSKAANLRVGDKIKV